MINREQFYLNLKDSGLFRTIGLKNTKNTLILSVDQNNGINAILDEWELNHSNDNQHWLAYMLATTYHETAKKMIPIEEYGKGLGRLYGKKIKHAGVSYSTPDKLYYGRGLIQLTWYENYELMGRLLHIDLLNHPELALDSKIAVQIMFEGMLKGASSVGDFTGKCLEQYFTDNIQDWIGARKIINGTDKAELIAEYGIKFYNCLQNAIMV